MRKYDNFYFKDPIITDALLPDIELSIIIPSFYEHDIIHTLESIIESSLPAYPTEVLIVLNQSQDVSKEINKFHESQYEYLKKWAKENNNSFIRFYPIFVKDIPPKVSGVGYARKIGMDEAYRRLMAEGKSNNIMISLDADTLVEKNYISVMGQISKDDIQTKAYSINFEHLIDQNDEKIIDYELHLRYYINIQRLIDLPFAYYTIGSAMAVRAGAYGEVFGMNIRQAGEDFYFLHKFITNGNLKEVNTTSVYPSGRVSNRTPFGTGKAISKSYNSHEAILTYNYKSFIPVKDLIDNLNLGYTDTNLLLEKLPKEMREFLTLNDIEIILKEIRQNTANYYAFVKRFYRWFDAFRLMKYLHHVRKSTYPDLTINDALKFLFDKINLPCPAEKYQMLMSLRHRDRNGNYKPHYTMM